MSGLDFCLVACRFVHFVSLMFLAGGTLLSPALTPGARPQSQTLMAGIAAATTLLWLMLLAAAFTSDTQAMISPHVLALVLADTAFGHVWTIRLILAAAMLVVPVLLPRQQRLLAILALAMLATLGFVGHAADGGWPVELAQAAHLMAGGIWLGGLTLLLCLTPKGDVAALARALRLFSRLGPWLVAVIALSGLINAATLLRGPRDLIVSDYGQMLSIKLLLVMGMLVFAANNRFRLAPELAERPVPTRRSLLKSLACETLLGLGVLAATALLGMLAPPGD